MLAASETRAPAIRIKRDDASLPILAAYGKTEIAVRAGTVITIGETDHTFHDAVHIPLQDLKPGRDYAVTFDAQGDPVALDADDADTFCFAGFHFAPGGNAEGRSGGDTDPAINPFSLWDLGFRPSCPDPRGMVMVEAGGQRFWVDIYLLARDHKAQGTSRYGVKIADGASLDRLDFATAKSIYAEHGKRLLTYDEFRAAAFGVTEKSSSPRDPDLTGLDPARTSRFGLMQATGNLSVWGTDGDEDYPRASLFGGSWFLGDVAGSRYAGLDLWAENSLGSVSARGACDHLAPV